MQTYEKSLSYDHAGAKWMVPFATAMVAMVLFIFAMLAYSYL